MFKYPCLGADTGFKICEIIGYTVGTFLWVSPNSKMLNNMYVATRVPKLQHGKVIAKDSKKFRYF